MALTCRAMQSVDPRRSSGQRVSPNQPRVVIGRDAGANRRRRRPRVETRDRRLLGEDGCVTGCHGRWPSRVLPSRVLVVTQPSSGCWPPCASRWSTPPTAARAAYRRLRCRSRVPGISLTSTLASRSGYLALALRAGGLVGVDVVVDPAVEPVLAVVGLHERADLVAGHHLEVMGEPRGRHDVGQPRRDGRVGGRLGAVVLLRLLRRSGRRRTRRSRCSCSGTAAGSRACSARPRGGR